MLPKINQQQHSTDVSTAGRVVIITGANSGVGLAAAKRYAQGGAHVVMVCRNPAKAEVARQQVAALATGPVDVHLADLSVMAEVHDVCDRLLDAYPQIHILINNAGLHSDTLTFTRDGYETCWAVNHLAPFLMTMRLLERMKESAPARILNISSQGHRFCGVDLNDLDWTQRNYRGLRGYGQSKTANLFFTYELARKLEGTGVTVNAQHPGEVKSNIGSNNRPAWRALNAAISFLLLKDVSIAGEALYWLGAAPEAEGVSGRFFNLTNQEKPHPHAIHKGHETLAHNTWLLSEQQTGLVVPLVDAKRPVKKKAKSPSSTAN